MSDIFPIHHPLKCTQKINVELGIYYFPALDMVFDYIQNYPHRTKQILGISYEQLQSLLNCTIKRHQEIKAKQESRKIRIKAAGGGRKELLVIQEQVCLCLFYLRQMPTFQVLGRANYFNSLR